MLRTVTNNSTIMIMKYTWYHTYREMTQITGGLLLWLHWKPDLKVGRRKLKCSAGHDLTLEIHLSCRTSAAKFYLSHLKFTCPNKPPQYHWIVQIYNLLAALNKEWCFCLLYIYLWNTSTWRQSRCKDKHMDWNFRDQVTLTSQP